MVLRDLIEIDQSFDDGDSTREQDAMNMSEFLRIEDIGDGKLFHAKDADSGLDAPMGELFANAGKIPSERFLSET